MILKQKFWLLIAMLLGSLLIISACTLPTSGDTVRTELVTVVFIITETPDPNASPNYIIVTATPDRAQVDVPDSIVTSASSGQQGTPQFGVTQLPDSANIQSIGSNVPVGCIEHTIADGDTIFALADEYGVNGFVMMEVNGFSDDDAASLQIGDTIIVPIDGCPIEQIVSPTDEPLVEETEDSAEATGEVTESPENLTPTVTPTITLAPTAVDSEITIVEVLRAGDVTAEGVSIRNNGKVVDIEGWIVRGQDGNEYVFEEQLIFPNSVLTLFTRSGQDTPVSRFWGLEAPVWESGDVVTLLDADGDVQASYRIPLDLEAP
jgi:lamin tail-like protein/LysM domain-containing protein